MKKSGGALAAFFLTLALILTVQSLMRPEKEVLLPVEPTAQAVPESPEPMMAAVVTASITITPEPTPEPTTEPAPAPDEAKVEMLACLIYSEAGGDECSDECRINVGDVALNRVNDPRFPDTLEEVLTAPLQYGLWYITGIVWPERASNPLEAAAVERAYEIARRLLSGEHGDLYEAGYVWQAEFEQGQDVIYLDGIYFGR